MNFWYSIVGWARLLWWSFYFILGTVFLFLPLFLVNRCGMRWKPGFALAYFRRIPDDLAD